MKKLYKRLSLSLALLLMLTSVVLAQENVVTGTVLDETGAGMPGVNVLVKGTTQGTVTNAEGKYSISAQSDATLVFTFVGYKTSEVSVGGRTTIDLSMEQDATSLDEVVVIGYGTQKRSDLTGAVGSVSADKLQERPATSLNQALSGKIAGVQVNTNSGRPGGKSNVRIRGFSSINSSNNPLYVVDGVQLPQGNQDQFSTAIDYLNPNDIESVEVLKDASSTAIYGARGANGVILITTKRGKSGEGKVTYNVDFSVPTIGPNKREVLNADEYMAVEDLAWRNMEKFDPVGWNAGKYVNLNPVLRRTDPRIFDANGNNLYDTDWLEETTQHKLSQNHQLGFTGGNDRTTYTLSLGYRDDQGFLKQSYLNRYSGRFTIDDQVKSWLKVGGTLSYNIQSENLVDITDQVGRQIVEDFPFLPVKYADGKYANNRDYPNAEGTMSSMHRLHGRKYILNTQTTLGSVYTNINFTKNLEMRTVLGVNVVTQENNESINATLNTDGRGQAQTSNERQTFWSFENYLTYSKTFNEIHSLTAMLGVSWQEQNRFYINADVRNFPSDFFGYNNLGAGNDNKLLSSNAYRYSLNSYFGRVNYSLMGKYLLTITGRADGSSKFGENNKFSFFPSAALAWRVSDEGFLSDNSVISNLKVRTSYGLTGNSEIPAYISLGTLSSGNDDRAIWNNAAKGGTGVGRLANPDLKWEKTAQSDLGVELGLFNNRITLEADVYYRKTTDMLLDAPVPQTSGYATMRRNIGSMENKGLELSLSTVNVESEKFTWRTTFNVSVNRNKVLSLATPSDLFNVGGPGITNPTNIIRIGQPADSFWGLVRLGTWSTDEADEAAQFTSYRNNLTMLPGDIKYLDVNGDKAITDADRMIIGRGSPDAWGAFTNYVRYGAFDLTLELQYSYGNDIMDMNLHSSEDRQGLANSYKTVLNAWTPENQNTMIAQVRGTSAGYVTNVDSHWVQDGSFIRGRNLLLGFTFPQSVLDRLKLDRLRLYTSAQNFFLIVSDEVIGDPEITPIRGDNSNNAFSQGMKWHEYPKATTFMLGLQVGL
ncbi:TonB-dependent receptor [Chryseolinea sp. H1M3-3]|uniref:SusC/RagA family TonB-linked outer membrane protein n=1 Tax=Chryseolinea sp. H1M3-3 TaxID=3034144 RepID=UPI0023EE23A6|nr:TonB-dependent receptor [Chryseolinea sp. H1M3-3]